MIDAGRVPLTLTPDHSVFHASDDYAIQAEIGSTPKDPLRQAKNAEETRQKRPANNPELHKMLRNSNCSRARFQNRM